MQPLSELVLQVPAEFKKLEIQTDTSLPDIAYQVQAFVDARNRPLNQDEKEIAQIDLELKRSATRVKQTRARRLIQYGLMDKVSRIRKKTEFTDILDLVNKHPEWNGDIPTSFYDPKFPEELIEEHLKIVDEVREENKPKMARRRDVEKKTGAKYPVGSLEGAEKTWEKEANFVRDWATYLTEKGVVSSFADRAQEILEWQAKKEEAEKNPAMRNVAKQYEDAIRRLAVENAPVQVAALLKYERAVAKRKCDFQKAQEFLQDVAKLEGNKDLDLSDPDQVVKLQLPETSFDEEQVNKGILAAITEALGELQPEERKALGDWVFGAYLKGQESQDRIEFYHAAREMIRQVVEAAGGEMPDPIYEAGEVAGDQVVRTTVGQKSSEGKVKGQQPVNARRRTAVSRVEHAGGRMQSPAETSTFEQIFGHPANKLVRYEGKPIALSDFVGIARNAGKSDKEIAAYTRTLK